MNDPAVIKRLPTASLVTALFAALAFFALLSFPTATPSPLLDASWSSAFGYFFKHRLHAGTDYIFTYGPLGFLLTAYFDPDTFPLKWIYEVALKAYIITEIIRITRLQSPDGDPVSVWFPLLPLGVLTLTFAFAMQPGSTYLADAFAYITLLVLGTAAARDTNLSLIRVGLTLLIVAILSLAKATLLILAIPVVLLCALRVATQKIRPFFGMLPLLLFPLLWIALWLLLGQSITNILSYFIGALSVATGYNEAMAFNLAVYRNSAAPLAAALIGLGTTLVALRSHVVSLLKPADRSPITILHLLTVGLILLLVWKHGFTRGDNHTKITFLTLAFTAPFLLVTLPEDRNVGIHRALIAVATLCGMFGVVRGDDGWFALPAGEKPIVSTVKAVITPFAVFSECQARLSRSRILYRLPHIQAIVGNSPVGMWSLAQGVVLLNDLHYRPHPSFQGYNDYTRYLQERDIAFFQSEAAPEFVIFHQETIDHRFPTLDGGPAFTALLLRYELISAEGDYLLLRRRPLISPLSDLSHSREAATTQIVAANIPASVPSTPPGTLQMVAIELTPTLTEKLHRLLYKPSDVYLQVKVVGVADLQTYRLIPTMAAQGFILNPALETQDQFVRLYTGNPLPRIEQITVAMLPDVEPCFTPQIKIRFYTVPFPNLTIHQGKQ